MLVSSLVVDHPRKTAWFCSIWNIAAIVNQQTKASRNNGNHWLKVVCFKKEGQLILRKLTHIIMHLQIQYLSSHTFTPPNLHRSTSPNHSTALLPQTSQVKTLFTSPYLHYCWVEQHKQKQLRWANLSSPLPKTSKMVAKLKKVGISQGPN